MAEETTMTTQTAETSAAGSGTEAQVAAGAEGTQEKATATAFQKFLDGLFGNREKPAGDGTESGAASGEAKADGVAGEKSFSRADVDAAIEAAKQEWAAQAEEEKRIAKLSPEEKAAEEQKKKDEQIADLQAKLLTSQLRTQATAALEKDGYPVGLAEMLDYSSKEAMEKSMENLTGMFKGSLEAAVNQRLRGKVPEGLGAAASTEGMLKDQIAKNIRGL